MLTLLYHQCNNFHIPNHSSAITTSAIKTICVICTYIFAFLHIHIFILFIHIFILFFMPFHFSHQETAILLYSGNIMTIKNLESWIFFRPGAFWTFTLLKALHTSVWVSWKGESSLSRGASSLLLLSKRSQNEFSSSGREAHYSPILKFCPW